MKLNHLPFALTVLAMMFVLSVNAPSVSGQTKSKKSTSSKKSSSKKSTKKKTTKKTTAKKSEITGRLPYHYGKLELSDEQREKIYKIQAKHSDALEKIQKQLEAIKKKINGETEKVLTTTQRRKLAKFRADAAKASSKSKKK